MFLNLDLVTLLLIGILLLYHVTQSHNNHPIYSLYILRDFNVRLFKDID